jgi:hypothetical protein
MGGRASTRIPFLDSMLELGISGNAGKYNTTFPDEWGMPREHGIYKSLGGLDAAVETPGGSRFGLEYSPNALRKLMLRGRIPF